MRLFDVSDLDEAMNAIKDEIAKELSESLLTENNNADHFLDIIETS